MEDKIFEELHKESTKTANKYLKKFGIIEKNENVQLDTDAKNIDLLTILSKLNLVDENTENLDKIHEFYETLFKYGILGGVRHGKYIVIYGIKNNLIDFDKLMKIDPTKYVTRNFEPTFINDMKKVMFNEK